MKITLSQLKLSIRKQSDKCQLSLSLTQRLKFKTWCFACLCRKKNELQKKKHKFLALLNDCSSELHVELPSETERLPPSNEIYLLLREEYFLTRPYIIAGSDNGMCT